MKINTLQLSFSLSARTRFNIRLNIEFLIKLLCSSKNNITKNFLFDLQMSELPKCQKVNGCIMYVLQLFPVRSKNVTMYKTVTNFIERAYLRKVCLAIIGARDGELGGCTRPPPPKSVFSRSDSA
jgi:hypothetical protein